MQLAGLESKSASHATDIIHELDSLRHDILGGMERNDYRRNEVASDDSDQVLLRNLSTAINALLDGSRGPSPDVRVLKQLYFPNVYDREDSMETATDSTFRWILEDGFDEKFGEDDTESRDEDSDSSDDDSEDHDDSDPGTRAEEKPAVPHKKKDRGESHAAIQRRIAKENRVKARAKFTTWLQRDNGVFHISGKPGSGKSTLMKFVHGHPNTMKKLRAWAGSKQLVFGHFFFFKAGGKFQKSLEGLQRSILFETLKQCPELIEHVLPEAFRAFSRNPAASSIDELFFRPSELDQAMNRLASVPTAMGYRICFFIDGLDEYEDVNADELHHERLAEQFFSWASSSEVKILVSSRPYRVFQEAFLDERRIRVQDLTDIDITLFGRKMFEKDKCFDQVRPFYRQLVNQVVTDSAGVFLWARLAVRSLIMATRRDCSRQFLEQQLGQTPQSISALYAQLLASINPIDRDRAYKMLLFVSRLAESDVSVYAPALTWMDSLENPNFPMCSEPRPYTKEEGNDLRKSVQRDLEDCTKGLLELTTNQFPTMMGCPITTDMVRFFHRTILDFVRESETFRQVSKTYPKLGDEDMIIRMLLTEIWHIASPFSRLDVLSRRFREMAPSQKRDEYLDAFERAISYHNTQECQAIGMVAYHPTGSSHVYWRESSFLHWAASTLESPEYVIRKLKEKPHLLRSRKDLSLVLSVAFNDERHSSLPKLESPRRLTPFFQLGISPNEKISIYKTAWKSELLAPKSCWAVFCTFFAMRNIGTSRFLGRDKTVHPCYFATQLEDFLLTGDVDTNCVILLNSCGHGWPYNRETSSTPCEPPVPTHYIHLTDLIGRLSSDNHDALSRLISIQDRGLWKSFKSLWSYAPPPQNDLSVLKSTYPVCDDELLVSDETHVVSLVWENEQMETTSFDLALH